MTDVVTLSIKLYKMAAVEAFYSPRTGVMTADVCAVAVSVSPSGREVPSPDEDMAPPGQKR